MSQATVTYDRALCLYALLTHRLIDFGSLALTNMIGVWDAATNTSLPYGVLITKIAEHAGVSLAGEDRVGTLGPYNAQFIAASRSHLRGAEPGPRPPPALGAAPRRRVGNADHDHIRISLKGL